MTTTGLSREPCPEWGASLGQHLQISSFTDASFNIHHMFDGLTDPYAFHDGGELLRTHTIKNPGRQAVDV
tara:strand:+ start:516 stop:725 length:210 start_codon:yes stop_codon:yes gene_type:complete